MRRLFSVSFISKPASLALCALLAAPAIMFAQDQTSSGSTDTTTNSNPPANTKTTNKNAKSDTDAIGDRNVACKVNFYSIEKEIALGKSLAQEVERQAKIVNDPVIAEYVNRLGQNLVRNSDAKVPFTIKVIDGEEVNAFALPGGFFFVYSGLILKADSEAELAGVMAHEIAHVAARHGTCQQTKGEMVQIGTIPLIFLGGWAGYGIRQGVSLLIPMGFLQFSREYEKQADYLGLQYMYKAGYDPTAFVDFFEKIETMEKRKPGTMAKVFSTHPMTEDRIVASQKEIATILKAKPEYVVTTSEFNDVKGRLMAMHNVRKMTPSKDADPNKPTLRRNPNSTTPIEDETDPTTKSSKGDDDERPTLKRRPTDNTPDSSPTTTSAPTTAPSTTPDNPNPPSN
jgi:beta-barrel assembly-enhancing protease